MTRPDRSAYHRERRASLVLARRCISCTAALQPDDTQRCVECAELARLGKAASYDTVEARRTAQRYRATHREQVNAYAREKRLRKKLRNECEQCASPAAPDCRLCPKHHASTLERQRNAYARKVGKPAPKAKPLSRPRVAQRTHDARAARDALVAFRAAGTPPPLVADDDAPTMRVLRALRWLEWPTAAELIDAIAGLTHAGDPVAYGAWAQLISRAARSGLIERRGDAGGYEHRLTAAGAERLGATRAVRRAA